MSWNMLNNGICPPELTGFRFTKVDMGNNIHLASDNAGRIFTWGSASDGYTGQTPVAIPSTPNFSPHPSISDHPTSGLQMRYPYQVGNLSNWHNPSVSTVLFAAQDADGYIYAWGDGYSGAGGWALNSKYLETGSAPSIYTPGGDHALVPTLVNNTPWRSFVSSDEQILAISLDGRVYVWGRYYNHSFGMPGWTNGQRTFTPVLINTLPNAPVKLIAGEYNSCIAVLEDNSIYVWGDSADFTIATPTLVPLSLPTGVQVLTVKACYGGFAVLLSNGSIYTMGDTFTFGSSLFSWHLVPGGHNFVELDAYDVGIAARDANNALWGWGNASYLVSRDDTFCDEPAPTEPVKITNQNDWVTFAVGERTHAAIDREGRLWTWGNDLYGSLGINWSEIDPSFSCSTVQVAHPTLDSGVLAYDESGSIAAMQFVIPSSPQLSEHNPCGHWHKKLGEDQAASSEILYPRCCWSFAAALSGSELALHAYAIKEPFSNVSLRYNLATRLWNGPHWRLDGVYCGRYLNGAALNGGWDGALMYAETTGAVLVKLYEAGTPTIWQTPFPNMIPQVCDGRIAVGDSRNLAAILLQTPTHITLYSASLNSPVTFAPQTAWPISGTFKGARILHTPDGYFYVAVFIGTTITFYQAFNLDTWVTRGVITVVTEATNFNIWTDGGTIFALCHNKLYYSVDSAATFTARDTTAPAVVGVANGPTQNALIFYPDRLEMSYINTPPTWRELSVVPEVEYVINNYTFAHNAGDYVLYMHENIFVNQRIAVPLSYNFGESWEIVQSPLDYFDSTASALAGTDDPRWKFTPQPNKILLDPQYV